MSNQRTKSCCLTIDASIARAAGGFESEDLKSSRCRDFLIEVRAVCHHMAWSSAIKAEWDLHQSVFAGLWLAKMMKLKKLRPVTDEESAELREAIEEHSNNAHDVKKMLKDAHLFEAALATDRRIASLDENAHDHFKRLAATFDRLKPIQWVNPVEEGEQAIEWLKDGAPSRPSRRLKR